MVKVRHYRFQQITKVLVSIVLIAIGLLVLVGALRADDPRIWVGLVLVLVGLVALPGSTQSDGTKTSQSSILVAVTMVAVGGYIVLRDVGIIEVPVLGYSLAAVLVGTGMYGVATALLAHPAETK